MSLNVHILFARVTLASLACVCMCVYMCTLASLVCVCSMDDVFDGVVLGSGIVILSNFVRNFARSVAKGSFHPNRVFTATSVKVGLLLGVFMGLGNSGRKREVFVAGMLIHGLLPDSLRRILTIFVVSRGFSVKFPQIFFRHHFLVSLVSNFLALGAFLNRPDLLSVSYLKFLERFTKQHGSDFERFRKIMHTHKNACNCMHPNNQGCVAAFPAMFWDMFVHQSVLFYARLYAPLIAVSFISSPANQKNKVISAGIRRIVRSALTLSTYTSTVLSACCIGTKLPTSAPRAIVLPILATTVGSASFLIESDHRQYQLSQFMMVHGIDVIVRFYESLKFPIPSHVGPFMFASGLTALVDDYWNPDNAANNANSFFKYVLDQPDRKHIWSPSRFLRHKLKG